ncbi:MAG: MFS transporter [Candidatus Lokiarchaeota archaeon]|nr:MFS transporter [Candidatus Lokiarchaeota archaeon]MBD3340274.1 MFS transporter [Candidatus Lokiarchaeota archaeon]
MNESELKQTVNEKEPYGHSKFVMASYGGRELFGQWIAAAFGFTVFFFYEAVIGLNVILAAIAFVLYSVWNAINDPLLGWFFEKIHTPWEKKWNLKRFPWLVIGAVPWLLSYFLIFLVPSQWDPASNPNDNLPVFLWFLVTICIYDTCNTMFDVNVLSLYPEKFRGLDERRTVQGFGTILGIIGLVLAAVIPPMFITTGVRETYQTAALVTTTFGIIIFLFAIPGVWEDKFTRERYKHRREMESKLEVESFFQMSKKAISNRNFLAKVVLFYGYQVGAVMLQYSAFYIVTYLLDMEAGAITYLLGAMLVGALFSVPLWLYISKKMNNNKKLSVMGAIGMLIAFVPMIFVSTLIGWIIVMLIFGLGLGGQWFSDPPTLGDIIDDVTAKTGKRQQGIYYGFQAFFIRLGYSTIAVTLAVVHTLTGFVEGAPSLGELRAQSPTPDLALFGIRIHTAIVPAILVLITVLIFWKYYKLTPDRVAANKAKIKELGI